MSEKRQKSAARRAANLLAGNSSVEFRSLRETQGAFWQQAFLLLFRRKKKKKNMGKAPQDNYMLIPLNAG